MRIEVRVGYVPVGDSIRFIYPSCIPTRTHDYNHEGSGSGRDIQARGERVDLDFATMAYHLPV